MSGTDGGARAPRKTRAESRDDTRVRLRQAAWDAFVQHGFAAASVEDIAARAGFSRGAFYSNFADKDEIFLTLMDDDLAGRVASVTRVMVESSPLALFEDLRTWSAGNPDDPIRIALIAEFRAHALRNDAARQRLAERSRALRGLYAQAIQAQYDAVGVALPAPVGDLALILEALDNWFALAHALDPDVVREGALFDALGMLFRAGVALSEARAERAADADAGSPSR